MAEEEQSLSERTRKPLEEAQIRTAISTTFDRIISASGKDKIRARLLYASPRNKYVDIGEGPLGLYSLDNKGDIELSLQVFREEMDKRGFSKANYKPTRVQEFPEGTHGNFREVGLLRHEEGVTTSEIHPGVVVYSKTWRDQDKKRVLVSEWEVINEKVLDERTPEELKRIIDEGLIRTAIALEEAGVATRFPSIKTLKEMLRRVKKKKG